MKRISFWLCTALAIVGCSPKETAEAPTTTPETTPTEITETPWAVAAAHPLAAQAGAKILEQGGTAVDAAVAIQAVLGLVEPQSSGLGGGAFMLYYDAETKEITSYDGREVAPASAKPDMFLLDDGTPMGYYDAIRSGYSVGIPGAVSMLAMAHKEYGSAPWPKLFVDAETIATEGFEVYPRLSYLLGRFEKFAETPAARALYYTPDGDPVPAGTILKNPDYAETVHLIATEGPDAYYNGPIAEKIISAVNSHTGHETLTKDDFTAYAPSIRPNVCGMFMTYEVCSMGPPSSGGVTLIQILGLFERSVTKETPQNEAWAKYVEASRLAYADRALYLADPSGMTRGNVTSDTLVEALINPAYLDSRAPLIGELAALDVHAGEPIAFLDQQAPDASPPENGTSHFVVRDSMGNIVSMTTTVEFAFGSHLMAGGMVLNNQLTDFSFLPEIDGKPVANAVAPGKKPRSSMSPVIVFENETPVMAVGSPGGSAIIGYVAKTIIANLYYGEPLQEAVNRPNLVVPSGQILAEKGTDDELISALTEYGYEVLPRDLNSGVHAFRIHEDGHLEGAADPRRDGVFLTATP